MEGNEERRDSRGRLLGKRAAPGQINRLDGKMMFALTNYVQAHYAESGMLDPAFAEKAASELGFPVTVGNIHGAREILDLPSNRDVQRAAKGNDNPLAARVERLEKELRSLQDRVEVYLKGCRGDGGAR